MKNLQRAVCDLHQINLDEDAAENGPAILTEQIVGIYEEDAFGEVFEDNENDELVYRGL